MTSSRISSRTWAARLALAGVFICGMLVSQSAASAEEPSVVISRPIHEETLHDNTGTVMVSVSIRGKTLTEGRQLRVLLDGNSHGANRRALDFTLEDVARGSHTLQVQLLDAREALIAESPVVTFHLWQASKFLPPRKPTPPPHKH